MYTMLPSNAVFASSLLACLLNTSWGFKSSPLSLLPQYSRHDHARGRGNPSRLSLTTEDNENQSFLANGNDGTPTRRDFFASMASSIPIATTALVGYSSLPVPPARAAEDGARSTANAAVTDKIFIEFKGLSAPGDESVDRITIGLFGKDAPQPVSVLKQTVTREGYKSKCKPLDASRLLQKEQLEANRVYNTCMANEDGVGVNYEYSTVWRVVRDERIDVGAVSGKFVARENPTFEDAGSGLVHDAPGVVSVHRGDEAGYGFTIFPGGSTSPSSLDEENVVVGRIVEGMDVVGRLNGIPVVKSVSLTGGGKATKNAPSRGCRYGGSEYYCSEDKPLKKVTLDKTGLL